MRLERWAATGHRAVHNTAVVMVHMYLTGRRILRSFAARELDMLGSDLHAAVSLDTLNSPDAQTAGLFHLADYAGTIISICASQ